MTDKRGARRKREDELDRPGLAAVVSAYMREHQISQAELVERSGVSPAYVRHIHNGTGTNQFSYEVLASIARAFGWPDRYLYHKFYRLPEEDPAAPSGAERLTQEIMTQLEPHLAKIDAIQASLSTVMDAIHHVNNRLDAILDLRAHPPGEN